MDIDIRTLLAKLNPECKRAMGRAAELCVRLTHFNVELEHLLFVLIDNRAPDIALLLERFDIDAQAALAQLQSNLDGFKRGNGRAPALSAHFVPLFQEAWLLSSMLLGTQQVRSGTVMLALFEVDMLRGMLPETAPALLKVPRETLRRELSGVLGASSEDGGPADPAAPRTGAMPMNLHGNMPRNMPNAGAQPSALLSDAEVADLEALMAPIAADDPSGASLRFDPSITAIRLAREEDDASLPMGVWAQPLKCADWAKIAEICRMTLTKRSKDLQIAAWLTEAWMRQTGVEGLFRGLLIVERLTNDFWDTVHPRMDDGDAEMRVAPLEWMNASLASTLRVRVQLLPHAARLPSELSLAEWERMTMSELAPPRPGAESESPESGEVLKTRDEITAYVAANLGGAVARRLQMVSACLSTVLSIARFTEARLGVEAPNMSKLRDTLRSMERVLFQMTPGDRSEPTTQYQALPVADPAPAPAAAGVPAVMLSHWPSRDDAYATLEAIADYLARVEPHSPTPFLLRRAVNWGRMSLPELMAEIIQEEGDLNRLGHLLGLNG